MTAEALENATDAAAENPLAFQTVPPAAISVAAAKAVAVEDE